MKTPCCWTIAEIRRMVAIISYNAQAAGGDGPGSKDKGNATAKEVSA